MGGLKWAYIDIDNFLFIAAADKDDDTSDIRAQVNIIRINFIKKYPECSDKDFNDKWNGNISQYDSFADIMDELVTHWRELEKVTDAAKMMDILEVFQQIFNRLSKILPSIKKGRKNFDEKMLHLKQGLPKSFENVSYSQSGWDLLTINVFHQDIDENELIYGLKAMLRFYVDLLNDIFKDEMPNIVRRLVFPYLRQDWSRISKLKLDEILVDLFLM